MGNACQAPKCKICGAVEWSHNCFKRDAAKARVRQIEERSSAKVKAASAKKKVKAP